MMTVVAAAAIGRSSSAGNKVDVESGAIVVGEYSIMALSRVKCNWESE